MVVLGEGCFNLPGLLKNPTDLAFHLPFLIVEDCIIPPSPQPPDNNGEQCAPITIMLVLDVALHIGINPSSETQIVKALVLSHGKESRPNFARPITPSEDMINIFLLISTLVTVGITRELPSLSFNITHNPFMLEHPQKCQHLMRGRRDGKHTRTLHTPVYFVFLTGIIVHQVVYLEELEHMHWEFVSKGVQVPAYTWLPVVLNSFLGLKIQNSIAASPVTSNSAIVAFEAKTKSQSISSLLVTACRQFRRTKKPSSGPISPRNAATRMPKPRSPPTSIYTIWRG
nr:hypothetical protein Iba_chr12fCG10190 [Ipomoea batatas]